MHRDLKPDNIMINENPLVARIIDFGTCKDLTIESGPHTSYVSTRWYRAPECVLRSHHYSFVSDVFAAGCVMAELYLQRPLFPGTSELDQVDKIFKILGTPKKDQWREGYRLAEKREIVFEDYPKKNLQKYLDKISEEALEGVKLMLKISAQKRGSAAEVLALPFFAKDEFTPSTQESRDKHSPDFSQSPPNTTGAPLIASRSKHQSQASGLNQPNWSASRSRAGPGPQTIPGSAGSAALDSAEVAERPGPRTRAAQGLPQEGQFPQEPARLGA